jgi:type IV pilus assembly protein PilW
LLVSDCYSGGIFQVTNMSTNDNKDNIVHNTGTGGPPGNWTKGLGKDYTGGEVFKLSTRTYFIRTGASGRPALWRKVGSNAADELVEGVDNMQILYGQDTNGDQVVDLYEPADDVADWSDVVAVRITLLVASDENNVAVEPQTVVYNSASSTAADRRIREVFTTTVGVRNKLP